MYLTELAYINKLLNPSISNILKILAEIVADIPSLICKPCWVYAMQAPRWPPISVIIKPFVGIFAGQGSQYLIV